MARRRPEAPRFEINGIKAPFSIEQVSDRLDKQFTAPSWKEISPILRRLGIKPRYMGAVEEALRYAVNESLELKVAAEMLLETDHRNARNAA